VQTTLLGFAIAIILALVAALVGPHFVDWGSYRGELEARASRLTGLEFRVTGAIDARLLPTPSLVLQGIEFGRPDDPGKIHARALRIEFALGALARGEWRITDARLEGPEFAAGLDAAGRLAWPVPKIAFDPEGVSIERLRIEKGRATLSDAASGSRLVLDKLEFNGELRSLAGPVKGEGSFVVAGQHYPYRVATSRIADGGAMKVHLTVDPIDRPLMADADIAISIERGMPRFEGTLQLARPVGRAPAGAQSPTTESWRISSRIKGDGTAAVLDQIEFQYGPDERAIKLKGTADLAFGRQPEVNVTLSSAQIDLDRVLALPDAARRRPFLAVKTLAESFAGSFGLPIPATLRVAVESVTLGGATLARVSGIAQSDGNGLDIKALELRAPGATQIQLRGRLDSKPQDSKSQDSKLLGVQFSGSASVEANDPRALVAWLTERNDVPTVAAGQLHLGGDVTLSNEAIAIDRLDLELDRMTVAGRLAYAWASDSRPARLDAVLTAPEIDLDRAQAVAKAILGDTPLDWPREGTLSLKIGRAVLAGVEAKRADIDMRIDANGLEIERLAVADFGGAALAVKGRIDGKAQTPRGALTLDLDARSLDGVIALVDKLAPRAADQIRRSSARITPVNLRGSLAVDPSASGAATVNAKFKLDGHAGGFRLALQGDGAATSDAFKTYTLAALGSAKLNLSGRLEADDGSALVELLTLDRFVMVDKRPGRLAFTAKGPLDGDLAVDGQLGAGPFAISANGTVRASDLANPTATLNLKVANANLRSPRPTSAGRGTDLLPASMTGQLALAEGTYRLTDMVGTVAGTSVTGRLTVGMRQQPITIDGDVAVATVDLPGAVAAALGIPAQSVGTSTGTSAGESGTSVWPTEPFEPWFTRLTGHVAVKSARVTLAPKLVARDVRGVLHFGESQLALQASDGNIAGGRIAGDLTFLREGGAMIARTRIRVAGASAADLLPGDGSLSGRLTLDLTAEGSGMSPIALAGSLAGSGTFMLESARVARLNPAAFNTVMRAVDQGLPIDAARVRDRMDAALASGPLGIALAEGAITINAGQIRLGNIMVRAVGADLTAGGGINLSEGAIDARLILAGVAGPTAPANTRPEVTIVLKGPIDSAKRTLEVTALSSWLALRAVEQQSKKLDLLEGREPPPVVPQSGDIPTGSATPQGTPAPAPAAPASESATPAATPATPAIEAPQPRSTMRPPPKPKPAVPTAEQVAPMPPPIDIRPAPQPRVPRAPRQAQPAAPPPPASPRSLSEILFGR
jgi:large subunit ribosomal protein L24